MKTESILFLDVDGVLNSQVWYRSKEFNELWKARRPFTEDWELEAFDPKAISVLNTILDTFPELQIVVSSTWRLSHTPEQLAAIMTVQGFKHSERMRGHTGSHGYYMSKARGIPSNQNSRGLEIAEWLDTFVKHPYRFVIIDDDSDMWELREHFVHTRNSIGLCEQHLEKIAEVLNKPAITTVWLTH